MFSCNTVMPWAPFEIYRMFIFMLFSLTELSFYNIFVSFFFFLLLLISLLLTALSSFN